MPGRWVYSFTSCKDTEAGLARPGFPAIIRLGSSLDPARCRAATTKAGMPCRSAGVRQSSSLNEVKVALMRQQLSGRHVL
jgi:hypothetical protein